MTPEAWYLTIDPWQFATGALVLVLVYLMGRQNGMGQLFAKKRELSDSEKESLRKRSSKLEAGRSMFQAFAALHQRNTRNRFDGLTAEEAFNMASRTAASLQLPAAMLEEFKKTIDFEVPATAPTKETQGTTPAEETEEARLERVKQQMKARREQEQLKQAA